MSNFTVIALTAIISSGATVGFIKYRYKLHQKIAKHDLANDLQTSLERELARARNLPGAESLLNALCMQTTISDNDVRVLSRKLSDLEAIGQVKTTRRELARRRRAPRIRAVVEKAMADYNDKYSRNVRSGK